MTDPIYKYEVQVAQDASSGADYNTLTDALAAISAGIPDWDAPSGSARYCIRVHPGTYNESVGMLSWVDIRGTSKHSTRLAPTAGSGAAVYLADNVQLEDLIIEGTTSDGDWAILGDDTANVHIRNVDILANGEEVSQGITISGDTWHTVFIEHCVINYIGTNSFGIHLTAGGQDSDTHMNDVFVDSFNAGEGYGSISLIDVLNARLRSSLVRTSAAGTAISLTSLLGSQYITNSLLLEGTTVETPDAIGPTVVVGGSSELLLKHSQVDAIHLTGTYGFLRRWERDVLYQLPFLGDLVAGIPSPPTSVQNPNGDIYLLDTGHEGGPSLKGLEFAAPEQTPYEVTLCCVPGSSTKSNIRCGAYWRDSTSGKLIAFQLIAGSLAYSKFDSYDSFNSDYISVPYAPSGDTWLRLRRDDTSMYAYYSPDGINYSLLFSTATGDFMTPDSVGFFIDAESTAGPDLDAQMLVKHFTSESVGVF